MRARPGDRGTSGYSIEGSDWGVGMGRRGEGGYLLVGELVADLEVGL